MKVHSPMPARRPDHGQRNRGRLFMAAAIALLISSIPTGALAQETHWLGRLVGTDYVFDTQVPADFAGMLTASLPKYGVFRNAPKPSTQVIDGTTYSFVTTSIAWDNNMIDNGQIAYSTNGGVGQGAWFTMDKTLSGLPLPPR